MADNITTVNTGTGTLPVSTTIATRDSGATGHWQQIDAAPASATVVAGSQHALSVGTGSPTTLTVPSGATHALLSVDSGGSTTGVRVTFDGTTPTATVGHLLAAGDAMPLDSPASVKLLAVTGTAVAQISYFKYV